MFKEAIGDLAKIVTMPIRVSAAIALTSWFFLLLPPERLGLAASDLEAIRPWRGCVWGTGCLFSLIAIFQIMHASRWWWARRRLRSESRKSLNFHVNDQQSWWYPAKQRDGSYSSQLHVSFHVLNRRDKPVKILAIGLRTPRLPRPTQVYFALPMPGGGLHSAEHPVFPDQGVWGNASIFLKGAVNRIGHPLAISLFAVDDRGVRYNLPKIRLECRTPMPDVRIPMLEKLKGAMGIRSRPAPSEILSWDWTDRYLESPHRKLAILVLDEERRNYRVRGRREGKLGSLSVGVQHEPNLGWTTSGQVPPLIWPAGEAEPLKSDNLERIMRYHAALGDVDKIDLEEMLTHYLHRASPYAEIAYGIFFCLHRLGRTTDAISVARRNLRGDKVYGFSNLICALAAFVSREHSGWTAEQIDVVTSQFDGDGGIEFNLIEKLNLARLQK